MDRRKDEQREDDGDGECLAMPTSQRGMQRAAAVVADVGCRAS